jgi:cell division septum initiation protein DivIVA
MNIDDLLELMDETLEDAFTVPLTGKRMVDADRLREIIDDVRLNLPTEIRQAKGIVKDRAVILDEARAEADAIIKKAEGRRTVIVSEQEIVKASEERAREILQNAQQHAKELRATTANYCENVLRQTEEQLNKSMTEVKNVRNNVRAKTRRV